MIHKIDVLRASDIRKNPIFLYHEIPEGCVAEMNFLSVALKHGAITLDLYVELARINSFSFREIVTQARLDRDYDGRRVENTIDPLGWPLGTPFRRQQT